MSGVFQNIDPSPPSPPTFGAGENTLAGWRGGWGVNILEDARHSSVLYICKYFVVHSPSGEQGTGCRAVPEGRTRVSR